MLQLNDPRNSAGRPVIATIGVSDIRLAQSAYCGTLGYECVDAEPVSSAYAKVWGEAGIVGRASRLLRPESGAPVFIRLVEADFDCSGEAPAGTGWFALEVCVQDSAALFEMLSTQDYFEPFAPPKALPFSDMVFPFQCRGRNGELLYLNETRGNLPEIDLPLAASFVDHVFIVVLGASQIDRSTEFYTELLHAKLQESHELAYKTINRVFELPLKTLHKLNTAGTGRNVFLEIDQLPAIAQAEGRDIAVPCGICCVSFALCVEAEPLGTAARIDDAPYCGGQVSQLFGPDGERIELVMIADAAV